jgi:hypothetical protein
VSDVREFFDAQAEQEVTKQEQLRRAKEEMAGPVPLIPDAPDCVVDLPRGLWVKGEFKRTAIVRELTGADEEALAKTREPQDFFDLVIALGVQSIDDFDLSMLPTAERQGHLRQLLIGERDQIFMAVVRATFGDTKTMGFRCSMCGEQQEVDLLLSEDFKPKQVEGVDSALFTYRTSKGQELEYRLVTGDDQLEAFSRKTATNAEQNTIILSRCITKLNGGMVPDPIAFVRGLSMRDRQSLLAELIGKQPTIDLTAATRCAACGNDQVLNLDWGDLFRPR